jgi:hypothetical protein
MNKTIFLMFVIFDNAMAGINRNTAGNIETFSVRYIKNPVIEK